MPGFVNPYTFIGLANQSSRSENTMDYDKRKLTGVLRCVLETLTPLFIPNTANEHAFPSLENRNINEWNSANPRNRIVEMNDRADVKSFDFYSYENTEGDRIAAPPFRPIIPGSSIKGMIRSAYETLTNSCLSSIDEDLVLHRRSPLAYNRRGSKTGKLDVLDPERMKSLFQIMFGFGYETRSTDFSQIKV